MSNTLITIILGILLFVYIIYNIIYTYSEVTYTKSDIDGNLYMIRRGNNKSPEFLKESANTLALINQRIEKLIKHLNDNYKNAIVSSGMDDIVMTTKLSGTPCAVINNESAKKMGYTQNWFEKWLSNNSQTKKWFKMLVQIRGMKKLEQSILPNNYETLWTAGKSSELIHDIIPCEEVIVRIRKEYEQSLNTLVSLV